MQFGPGPVISYGFFSYKNATELANGHILNSPLRTTCFYVTFEGLFFVL